MHNTKTSTKKLILFSCIISLFLFSLLELSARLFLSIKNHSLSYMLYGLQETWQRKNFEKIKDKNGKLLYYKGITSNDHINPVNSLGLRGPEIEKKDLNIIRIICLGGSTTYGTGLPYQDTYPALLQQKLDEKSGTNNYEVINAGQPGLNLSQIISFTRREILSLEPDVIMLMSINNNFKVPGFWFVNIEEKNAFVNLRKLIVKYLAVGRIIDQAVKKNTASGVANFFNNSFDWEGFSSALMASEDLWVEYEKNLNLFLDIVFAHNPAIQVIFLEQAFNKIDYPAMIPPFKRAKQILQKVSASHHNTISLNVHNIILKNAAMGKPVWQSPSFDPLHLSKVGNELIADFLADILLSGAIRTTGEKNQ